MPSTAALRHLLAIAVYGALALVLYGGPLLDGNDAYLGTGNDPQIFMWSYAWWPHALGEGIDPVLTHAVWAPEGMNLMWVTSVPSAALLLAPVTLSAGPVAAWNLTGVIAPALAAFCAYLLCAHVARAYAPALLGGALFGFSSYLAGQQLGHLHMTAVALVPLAALLVLRRCERSLGRRRFIGLLALLLVVQLGLSTELLLTGTLALAVSLLLAAWQLPERRAVLRATAREALWAYLVFALIASPLLVRALTGFESDSINSPFVFSADLVNLIVPTELSWASPGAAEHVWSHFRGNLSETGAYLGLPLLAAAALALRGPRSPRSRLLGLLLGVALVAALGPVLRVAGAPLAPLPWLPFAYLPPFTHVLPVRLVMYATLALGVLLACWLAHRGGLARYGLVLLGLVLVLPDPGAPFWQTRDPTPALFRGDGWRAQLAGERVLALPFANRSNAMLWQAHVAMGFEQTGGYLRPDPPARYDRYAAIGPLQGSNELRPQDAESFRRLLRDTQTTVVAVDEPHIVRFAAGLAAAGLEVSARAGGLVIYRVPA
jgi:hypothetical protein